MPPLCHADHSAAPSQSALLLRQRHRALITSPSLAYCKPPAAANQRQFHGRELPVLADFCRSARWKLRTTIRSRCTAGKEKCRRECDPVLPPTPALLRRSGALPEQPSAPMDRFHGRANHERTGDVSGPNRESPRGGTLKRASYISPQIDSEIANEGRPWASRGGTSPARRPSFAHSEPVQSLGSGPPSACGHRLSSGAIAAERDPADGPASSL
jgi:hypothetical protein